MLICQMVNEIMKNTYMKSIMVFALLILTSLPAQGFENDKAQQIMAKALTYSKNNNHALALSLSDQALQLKPNDLNLIYQRATIWGRGGYYMKSIEGLSLVIREDELSSRQRFPAARKFRAECYAALGSMQKAVDDYNMLLRRSPESGKIWYYLAEVLSVMGRNDWALQAIQRGQATKSHWKTKLEVLRKDILSGKKIVLHKPFSN